MYNHEYIVDQLSTRIPTYILRFEDLIMNPEPILNELFCFLLDVDTIKGTVIEKRIFEISDQGFTAKSVYALKNTSKDLNKNADMYNKKLLEELKVILKLYNIFYGYTNMGQVRQGFEEGST